MEEEKESPSSVGKAAIKIYEEKIGQIIDVKKYEAHEMSKPPPKKKKKKFLLTKGNLNGTLRLNEHLGRGMRMKALEKSL